MSNQKANTRVITSVATLSYPHLDKPQPGQDGGKPKYSAAVVFLPEQAATAEGKATIAALQAALIEAATAKFGPTWTLPNGVTISIADAIREKVLSSPLRDDAVAKGYPAGSIFFNARSEQQPGTVYAYKETGSDKPARIPQEKITTELYAGAQVRVSVTAFGYNHGVKKGVSFAINNVQKIGEGKRLDNRKAAEDEFTADMTATPADLNSLLG